MDINFGKVHRNTTAAVIVSIFSIVFSPFFYLFEFKNQIFNSLELSRLLLLCISISLPVLFLHLVTFAFTAREAERTSNIFLESALLTSSGHILVIFYSPCVLLFFRDITFRQSLYICISLELVFIIFRFLKWFLENLKPSSATSQ